jgi:hypothetical protein
MTKKKQTQSRTELISIDFILIKGKVFYKKSKTKEKKKGKHINNNWKF